MSKPEVFIIESLAFDDEINDRREGLFLSHILKLAGKSPIYYYLRTQRELSVILEKFKESDYRYLHISCHGNDKVICTTLDKIELRIFGNMVKRYLDKKRLFISACLAGNETLAEAILPSSGCLSLIGPKNEIQFRDSAIVWASFYHLMFKVDPRKMTGVTIHLKFQRIIDTFKVPFNYYYPQRDNERGFDTYTLQPVRRLFHRKKVN